MSFPAPVTDISVERIDGTSSSLAEHQGKVMMVVNVASRCGLTGQYDALEKLYREYRARGFVVCGFPANDFAGQEPGSNAEIHGFCRSNFGIEFPMYAKIAVTGPERHPLYSALVASQPKRTGDTRQFEQHLVDFGVAPLKEPEVLWNFEKFLLSREGAVVARFAPDMPPDAPLIRSAIERELMRG